MPDLTFGQQLGLQMAQQATGGIIGLALGDINDKRQLRQQEKLQALQIAGQKDVTNYNYAKQLQMWKDTNYKAQVEQLKMAGLNPGLLYGMSGGGGQTTGSGSGGNVTGGNAPAGGREVQDIMGLGIQYRLLEAQRKNIEADTANKEADTANKPKVGANIDASTGSLLQGIENAKAQESLTNVQIEIDKLKLSFDKATFLNRESIVNLTLSKINEEITILRNEKILSTEVLETKIGIVKMELSLMVLEGYLKKAQTENIQQDTRNKFRELVNSVQHNMREWDKLPIEMQKQRLEELKTEWEQSGMPKGVKDILDQIYIIPGAGPAKRNPVGFKQ